MIWISGVSPLEVLPAYVASCVALLVFGIPAAIQQQRFAPIVKDPPKGLQIDWARLAIVALILVAAIAANVIAGAKLPALGADTDFGDQAGISIGHRLAVKHGDIAQVHHR